MVEFIDFSRASNRIPHNNFSRPPQGEHWSEVVKPFRKSDRIRLLLKSPLDIAPHAEPNPSPYRLS